MVAWLKLIGLSVLPTPPSTPIKLRLDNNGESVVLKLRISYFNMLLFPLSQMNRSLELVVKLVNSLNCS